MITADKVVLCYNFVLNFDSIRKPNKMSKYGLTLFSIICE